MCHFLGINDDLFSVGWYSGEARLILKMMLRPVFHLLIYSDLECWVFAGFVKSRLTKHIFIQGLLAIILTAVCFFYLYNFITFLDV